MKTKLISNIEAKLTGNRMAAVLDYTKIDFKISDNIEYNHKYVEEYRIGVQVGSVIQIDAELLASDKEDVINYAMQSIGRGITEEVYGELRSKLIKLAIQLRQEVNFSSPTHNMVGELLEMITYD